MESPARDGKTGRLRERVKWKPIGLVLFSLLAAACDNVEENGYVIPAKPEIDRADLEISPDGSPLVFAQVGMNYATAAQLNQWEPRFAQRNVQCIAYAPGAGGWQSHPFRNLQPYAGGSYLLRDAKGRILALVENLHRHILYAYTGSDWQVKKSVLDRNGDGWGYGIDLASTGPMLALVGDTAWDSPEVPWNGTSQDFRLKIRRNTGALIDLDTVPQYGVSLMVAGESFNYLILPGGPGYNDTVKTQKLLCYRWSLDPDDPQPRKQVLPLDRVIGYGALFSSRVRGERRVYLQAGPDSLAEFALRNDTLSPLGYRSFPASPDTAGTGPYKQPPLGTLNVDPQGCVHSIEVVGRTPSPVDNRTDTLMFMFHSSSCEAAVDSVALPRPSPGYLYPQISGLRFAPDGTLMIALTLTNALSDPGTYGHVIPPSWLYLARRGSGGEWTWDKIAEY